MWERFARGWLQSGPMDEALGGEAVWGVGCMERAGGGGLSALSMVRRGQGVGVPCPPAIQSPSLCLLPMRQARGGAGVRMGVGMSLSRADGGKSLLWPQVTCL